MTEKLAIVIEPPDADAPGFLRRSKKALALQEEMTKEPSVKLIDELVEFILPYVKEPEDREEASELILDASQNQFMQLLTLLGGGDENPTNQPVEKAGK